MHCSSIALNNGCNFTNLSELSGEPFYQPNVNIACTPET